VKLLYILLSFVVLILAARPCCNDKDCISSNTTIQTPDDHSTSSEKECQGCSPFFSCGTCSGFVIAQSIDHKISVDTGLHLEHVSMYRQPFTENVDRSIWQPPQLG
jgi:hypothetical protein